MVISNPGLDLHLIIGRQLELLLNHRLSIRNLTDLFMLPDYLREQAHRDLAFHNLLIVQSTGNTRGDLEHIAVNLMVYGHACLYR